MNMRGQNRNLTLHTMPPPGGGLVIAFIMNILQGKATRVTTAGNKGELQPVRWRPHCNTQHHTENLI